MKILIISDTHGHIANATKIVKQITDFDRIIHLGDMEQDAEALDCMCPIPIDYVPGNCDYASKAPREKVLAFYGVKLFITHGHYYQVKWNLDTIIKEGRKKGVKIILFGHTHVAMEKNMDGITLFNPGSLTLPRDGKGPSYGVLEIEEDGKYHLTIKKLRKSIDIW
ncbi:metallophosphoesterase family protein [Vallitalea pronyensis]|uniref:Phosphoesterase n=1 Tax=Vallitalea pronyensis TaxID=1348613 RepID=A0A8J8SFV7_9FIRM|nr:metallophosphoesterase family protein [Vallitalea pronyensis]QUI21734.1 metallophosphoesterase family protein [Vallitalea pronyensis]